MTSTTAPSVALGGLRGQLADPLMRGAYSLMANTVLAALLGLVFWIVAARLYPSSDLGRDSTLIASMITLSSICQLNLANVVPRFLPQAADPSRALRLGYGASTAVALVLATAFVIVAPLLVPELGTLHDKPLVAAGFVLATALWGIFAIQDSALAAMRRAPWVPVANVAFGLLKLGVLPVALAVGAVHGVFQSWVIPMVLLLIPVNLLLFRVVIPSHRRDHAPTGVVYDRSLRRFLVLDYAATTFAVAGVTILPLLVLSLLGSSQSAYFYIVFTIVFSLVTLAGNVATSLIVESAFVERDLRRHARAATRKLLPMIVLAGVVVSVGAPILLAPFGQEYVDGGTSLLRVLAIGVGLRCVLFLFQGIARAQRRGMALVRADAASFVLLMLFTSLLAPGMGLIGVGLAFVSADALVAACVLPGMISFLRDDGGRDFTPTLIGHIDLPGGSPVAVTPGSAHGGHERARLLVRLHGRPIGQFETTMANGQPVDALERARALADGLEAPGVPADARATGDAPGISIVMCTRNRGDQLRVSIESVLDQSLPPLEVLVVDGGDAAATGRLLAEIRDPRVRCIPDPVPGLARARNTGADASTGDIIVFTDDDIRADRDWLFWIHQAFLRGPRVGVATGLVPAAELESPAQEILDGLTPWGEGFEPRLFDLGENNPGSPAFPYRAGAFGTGANFAFTREARAHVGPFDEALGAGSKAAGGEELDIFLRAILGGWTISYEPAAIVWHYGQREMDIGRQMRSYGKGLSAYAFKHLIGRGGLRMARALPSALAALAGARRESAHVTRVPRRIRLLELWGILEGPLGYLRAKAVLRARAGAAAPNVQDAPAESSGTS